MKIQAKVFFLVAVLTFFFGVAVFPLLAIQKKALLHLTSEGLRYEGGRLDSIIELKGDTLAAFATDYTYWDEMVEFVRTKDKEWAKENIDASFSTYRADLAAVYGPDYLPVYSVAAEAIGEAQSFTLAPETLSAVFSKTRLAHFFVPTPAGLMEIRAASIHYTSDPGRQREPNGYFVAGKLWDEAYVRELERLSGQEITLASTAQQEPALTEAEKSKGVLRFSRTLKDWQGNPVARLDVKLRDTRIETLYRLEKTYIGLLILAALASLLLSLFFFNRWVRLPLLRFSRAMKDENTLRLQGLEKEKSEFGALAAIIENFFEQRQARRKSEEELAASEEKLRNIMENINIGISVISKDMKIVSLNKKMREWFPRAALPGDDACFRVFNTPPRDEACPWCPTKKTLEDGLVHEAITETPTEHGLRNYRVVATPLTKEGKIVAAIEMVEDVTSSRQWALRLARINECFLGFTEDPGQNIKRLIDFCGETLEASAVFYSRLEEGAFRVAGGWNLPAGFEPEFKAQGSICAEVLKAGEAALALSDLPHTSYAASDPHVGPLRLKACLGYPVKIKDAYAAALCAVFQSDYVPGDEDKKIMGILASAIGIEEERRLARERLQRSLEESEKQRRAILNILEDMQQARQELLRANEEIKRTQSQLVQASKMSAIGQLASGVAHEINNPLTGVLNNVQLIKMESAAAKGLNPDDFKELLDVIEESALRCTKITKALLNFSHASSGAFAEVSLNAAIEEVTSLIAHEMKLQNISLRKDYFQDLPRVSAEPQLIQQVVFDLIANAKWAIQKKSGNEGGEIRIRTDYDPATQEVLFSISDTGIGIPEENLPRVFEPFFTTKPVGEGTGLGLAIIYNIIKEHHGSITVESQAGQGATFVVRLPAADKKGA